jgi:hypothetical protein
MQVPQHILCSNPMVVSWLYHKLAQVAYCKANIRPGVKKVHQGSNQLLVHHGICCRPNTHLGYRGRNLQSIWCVLGGKSRVKVLSPDPQLLRLGQLLAKPRGVVPIKIKLRLSKLRKKENFILGVYCFEMKLLITR